jgi:hypothetical protein
MHLQEHQDVFSAVHLCGWICGGREALAKSEASQSGPKQNEGKEVREMEKIETYMCCDAACNPKSKEKGEEIGIIDSMAQEKNEQRKSGEFFPSAEGKKRNGDERKSKPDGIKRKN